MPDHISARLYGIGIGPGDPGLVTLKAFRLLQEADIIFAPKARIKGESLARGIVEGTGISGANFTELEFPMVTDKSTLEQKWTTAAAMVSREIEKLQRDGSGRQISAAFITLGDPGIYSTWTYLQNSLKKTAPRIETETIPGISTMNAASAALNRPLITGQEKLALVPMPADLDELDRLTELFDTVVVYKVSNRLQEFCKKTEQLGLADSTSIVRKAGLPEEEIYADLSEITPRTEGYLSTAIIRCSQKQKEPQ